MLTNLHLSIYSDASVSWGNGDKKSTLKMNNALPLFSSKKFLQRIFYLIGITLLFFIGVSYVFSPAPSLGSQILLKEKKYQEIKLAGELSCIKGTDLFGNDVSYVQIGSQSDELRLCPNMKDCRRSLRIENVQDEKLLRISDVYTKNSFAYNVCIEDFFKQSLK
ncbi:MAG: hypothetical protein IPN70_01240 [Candidatus Moraniibacteriota bacterium]|nr:MAG: hypothetical protein IPN70_01240 [Candidatus Moranbacteria bacterium]